MGLEFGVGDSQGASTQGMHLADGLVTQQGVKQFASDEPCGPGEQHTTGIEMGGHGVDLG